MSILKGIVLTKRETIFIHFVCSKLTYKEIADRMNISERTIHRHRENVFKKLKINSRTELVLYAIKNNLYNFFE